MHSADPLKAPEEGAGLHRAPAGEDAAAAAMELHACGAKQRVHSVRQVDPSEKGDALPALAYIDDVIVLGPTFFERFRTTT
jgi:hypothetical protein